MTVVADMRDALAGDLAPSGVLRAAINLGNPVLASVTEALSRYTSRPIARRERTMINVTGMLSLHECGHPHHESLIRTVPEWRGYAPRVRAVPHRDDRPQLCLLLGCAERTALAPGGPGGAGLRPGGWRAEPGLRLAAAFS